MWSGNVDSYNKQDMIIPALVKSTTITESVFSWYMSGLDGKTYIDFGTPNEAVMSDPKSIVYLPIDEQNYYWGSTI